MLAYVIKRLLAMVPTLLGITLITFLIVNLAPGDPVATSFGAGGAEQSTDGSGGGQDQDRMADAIKAKKKLLGMVVEDYHVFGWAPPSAGTGAELVELERTSQLGDDSISGWPHAIAPAGDYLWVGGDDGALYGIDPDDGGIYAGLPGHDEAIWAAAASPDGRRLVSGDIDGVLKLWALDSWDSESLLATTEPLGRAIREILALPDGSGFLVASDDGGIRLHAADDLSVLREYPGHTNGVYALALSSDGGTFWSGGYDRSLRQWAIEDTEPAAVNEAHGQAINDIALAPDGASLVTACDDRLLRQIDLADFTGEPIQTFEGHYKAATAAAFSADGATLFSGSRDETIRAWRVADGAPVAQTAENTGRVHALVTGPDGVWSAADSWAKVPVWTRYFKWLMRTATLDFDRSFVDDQKVIDKIAKALPITIGLNLIAITIIYLVSIPLGVFAAVKRGSLFDNASSIFLFVLYSIPNFWLATLLIMFFSSERYWDVLPSVGLYAENHNDLSYLSWLWDRITHLILPVLTMVYAGFASLSRYARTSMLETIQEDYVRTARAKGLPERVVIFKHAFRNSLITIVTLVANLLPRMIGGSIIVEYIFSINGMGKLGFDAILARDYPTIMAITTFSAFLTLLGILVSDLLYSVVDPRVSQE